jgi:hypothetical protein
MGDLRDRATALRFITLTDISAFIAHLAVHALPSIFERACRPGPY